MTEITKAFVLSSAFLAMLFAAPAVHAFSTSGCEGDCTKCHTLSQQEAKEIIKKNDLFKKLNVPDAKVTDVKLSPVKSLWEVSLDNKGKSLVLYIDYSKTHVVLGTIVEIATFANKTAEQVKKLEEKRRVDVSKIPTERALVMGKKNPGQGKQKKVIIFTDPDCPYCAKLHQEVKKVIDQRKDVVFYLKLYPLQSHKDAYWKSKTIICGNSLQTLEDAFNGKVLQKVDCNTTEVDDTIKLAEKVGISGTPTVVFSDGRIRSGTMTAEQLIALIDGK